MKFDTIDFSQIALDIIKIQLLTTELSMLLALNIYHQDIKNRATFTIYVI